MTFGAAPRRPRPTGRGHLTWSRDGACRYRAWSRTATATRRSSASRARLTRAPRPGGMARVANPTGPPALSRQSAHPIGVVSLASATYPEWPTGRGPGRRANRLVTMGSARQCGWSLVAGRRPGQRGRGRVRAVGAPPPAQRRRPMITVKDAASEFLANKRIAVTGVSRTPQGHGGNVVYQRLRARGYEVAAINPNAEQVEGDRCYPDLRSVPGGVEAVVIGTRPETAEATMRECADLGIKYVWMHRPFGAGGAPAAATESGRRHGITVIDGGCPLMFDPTADLGHKAMRFVFTRTGKVPRQV